MLRHNKKPITSVVFMGDSLVDEKTMASRRLFFNLIPMDWLSGLRGRSPHGSFSNGYIWDAALILEIVDNFIIKESEERDDKEISIDDSDSIDDRREPNNHRKNIDGSDIADEIITHRRADRKLHAAYDLSHDGVAIYEGQELARNYAEGGLTSSSRYKGKLSKSISRFFTRLIVSNLDEKRDKLLAHDKEFNSSEKQKAKTLVFEWSGANDLITVNEKPSLVEVDEAIVARVKNVEELIKNGYREFVLFNLPDLSLTPRYQRKSIPEQENAKTCSNKFNEKLMTECETLKRKYPECSFEIFNVNEHFTKMYQNPGEKFDKNKLKTPFLSSPDFDPKLVKEKHISPAKGYMFWDDVHPTVRVGEELVKELRIILEAKYNFTQPIREQKEVKTDIRTLVATFKEKYHQQFDKDFNRFFTGHHWCRSHLKIDRSLNFDEQLATIFRHALYEGGNRTRKVITELGWIDKEGNLIENNPALRRAIINAKKPKEDLEALKRIRRLA